MATVKQQPPTPATVNAVKGNLITKSSPLATESCKLNTQFLTAQHMSSHYKRVIGARASIDNKPPVSMVRSQKARDRARREMMNYLSASQNLKKSIDTARSSQCLVDDKTDSKATNSKTQLYRPTKSANEPAKPRVLPDQGLLNRQMSEMMLQFTRHSANRVKTYSPPQVTRSQDFKLTQSSPNFGGTTASDRKASTIMNSIYSTRASQDIKPPLSHPALNATSKLVSGKNYDILDNRAHKFTSPTQEFQPRINKRSSAKSKIASSENLYQAPRRSNRSSVASTARDQIEDTSQFMKETNVVKKSNANLDDQDIEDDDENYFVNEYKDKLNKSEIMSSMSNNKNMPFRNQQPINSAEKEESFKYLAFLKEVTDDVLARGILSNTVINNCFEEHIQRNLGKLDEVKMREVLTTLQKNLGMPLQGKDFETNAAFHRYQTVSRAIEMDVNKENINSGEYKTLKMFGRPSSRLSNRKHRTDDVATSKLLNIMPLNNSKSYINSNSIANLLDDTDPTTRAENVIADYQDLRNPKPKARSGEELDQEDKTLFDTYESQIIKNIQSIRRKSLENANNSEVFESSLNISNSNLDTSQIKESSRKPSQNSANGDQLALTAAKQTTSSILKKPSQQSGGDSTGENSPKLISKSGSSSSAKSDNVSNKNKSNSGQNSLRGEEEYEDEDDLIFNPRTHAKIKTDESTSSKQQQSEQMQPESQLKQSVKNEKPETVPFNEKGPIKSQHISDNAKNPETGSKTNLLNASGSNMQHDDEDIFNYDYGKKSDEDDEDDERFSNKVSDYEDDKRRIKTSIRTSTAKSSKTTLHQSNRRSSLETNSEMSKSEATPRVAPRKLLRLQKEDESDDDKF